MKKFLAVSVMAIALLLPLSAFAQDMPNYFSLKAGAYVPSGDLDDADFSTGFSSSLVYGRYFTPNFAVELGVGYFESESDFYTIPLEVTALALYPVERGEVYVGAGIGAYFATFDGSFDIPGVGAVRIDDDDSVFGGHAVLGGRYDISQSMFFGVEGKYLVTDEVDVNGSVGGVPVVMSADLNGFTISASLGFRF
ncbi:MAG: hypothetical protein Kow0025_26390 [Thermodesulfovibrionales bacterium]